MGRDDTADAWHAQEAQQFRQRVSTELERVSLFYTKHERKMCRFFCLLEEKADALISSLDEEAVANGSSIRARRIGAAHRCGA